MIPSPLKLRNNRAVARKKKKVEIPQEAAAVSLNLNDLPDDILLLIFDQLGQRSKLPLAEDGVHSPRAQCDESSDSDFSLFDFHSHWNDTTDPEISAISNDSILFPTSKYESDAEYIDCQFNKLSLVCKRWKDLIDSHHLFSKTNFFDGPKSETDFQHLLKTIKKKFNSAAIVIEGGSNLKGEIQRVREFLTVQNKIKDVRLELPMDSIDASDLKMILEMFQQFESIYLVTKNLTINNFHEFENYLTKFPKLLQLIVSGSIDLLENLSTFIECRNLEILKIFGSTCTHNIGELLSFANQSCSHKLKSVDIFNLYHCPRICWTTKKLYLIVVNAQSPEICKFLTSERLATLESVHIDDSENSDLNNKICREAKNAEVLKVDYIFLKSLEPQTKVYSVKEIHVCDLIDGLGIDFDPFYQMFPNAHFLLEIFFAETDLSQQSLDQLGLEDLLDI